MSHHVMFSHERLIAYQRAIAFVAWSQAVEESLPSKVSSRDQLERASTSIPLNLAEGNGKFSDKDRARYWQIAHGCAVECAAILDVLVARGLQRLQDILDGKRILSEIVGLVLGLLNKLQTRIADRIGECAEQYLSVPCDSFPSPDQPASASD